MTNQPMLSAVVNFDFRLSPAAGGDRREGTGVVVGETVVGTDLAAVIKVKSSPHYRVGEIIHVRNSNVTYA